VELTGQQVIALPAGKVWDALNDPAILQQCIPGCDVFELTGENQYKVVMTATVGPIKAKFTGKLQLSDIVAPESYRLSFDGSGGAAGSGKGTAAVNLATVPEGTRLQYTVSATVAGRLAQVGARLIDGVAKKMADQFFARFKAILEPAPAAAETLDEAAPAGTVATPGTGRGNAWLWPTVAAAVVLIAIGMYMYAA
jgi:carbon monoxide dehydrogenase subunit G